MSKVRRTIKHALETKFIFSYSLPITAIPSALAFLLPSLILTLDSSLSNNVGLLLLCEVAVKPFYERTDAVRSYGMVTLFAQFSTPHQ